MSHKQQLWKQEISASHSFYRLNLPLHYNSRFFPSAFCNVIIEYLSVSITIDTVFGFLKEGIKDVKIIEISDSDDDDLPALEKLMI